MGSTLRWGCLTFTVALAGVGVLVGVGVMAGLISAYVNFSPSSADRARVRVMSRERILQGRPVGFARIRGVTRKVAKQELFGGVGENSVEVGDVVSVSSLTAAGDLLRLAQADGWVTGDQRCDLSREFPLAHQAAAQGPTDQVGFSGAKRLGDFVATLGVTVSPTDDGRPTARVELTARYHAKPDGPVGTRSVPGCIDALSAVGLRAPPIVPAHYVQPGPPTLVATDLHTGRRRWSKACDPGQLGQTLAAGDVIITSCGETLEALDPATGHLWWHFDASGGGLGPVLALDPADGLAVVASDEGHPTLGKDVHSGTQRWAVAPPPFSDEIMVPLADGPILARRQIVVDGTDTYRIVSLDPATGQARWQVDVGTQIEPLAAIGGNTLVLGTSTGLVGVDPTGGTIRWSLPAAPYLRRLIGASGVVVSWSDRGRELVGVDGATGQLLWRVQATDDIFTVVPGGPNLMVRTGAGVDILDRSTGKANAHLAVAPADTAQLSSGGIAVLGGDTLRWYDTSGLLRFSHPLAGPTRTMSIDPPSGLVVVIDANGHMQAIELTTGATRWTTKTAATAAPPVVISGVVLVRPQG